MTAHVLLVLLSQLWEKIRCEVLPSSLYVFSARLIISLIKEY